MDLFLYVDVHISAMNITLHIKRPNPAMQDHSSEILETPESPCAKEGKNIGLVFCHQKP